jgi:hypothetical protein
VARQGAALDALLRQLCGEGPLAVLRLFPRRVFHALGEPLDRHPQRSGQPQ